MQRRHYAVIVLFFLLIAGSDAFAADLTTADFQYLTQLTGMGATAQLLADMNDDEKAKLHDLINEPTTQRLSQRNTLVLAYLRDIYTRECSDWVKAHMTPSCPPGRNPDVQPGKEVADRSCHDCHLLGTFEAPSFHKMAAAGVPTNDQLRDALAAGHRMSPRPLSDRDLADLQAYIASLK
jgi:hypothetical protein